VKLPPDAFIAPEKISGYLLVRQARGDKSGFLARGGYHPGNPERLLKDLREQVLTREATVLAWTKFGLTYEIAATLVGPNGTSLSVRTIWMREHLSRMTKFITLIPA